MTKLNDIYIQIYNGEMVETTDFFNKTNSIAMDLERLMLDNAKVKFKQQLTGQQLTSLINVLYEDIEDTYIYKLILKVNNGYLIRVSGFDPFEEEEVINEWLLEC